MDFSVIRPKPPAKKPEALPPKPPSSEPKPSPPPAPPSGGGPPPPPRPHGRAPPPQYPPLGPYVEELDRISRMQRLRSIEYTNARTWRVNFGDQNPNDNYYDNYNYGNYEYSNHPIRVHSYDHHGPHDNHQMLTGPPRLALPQPEYHHQALLGPRLALPPPDYNQGPPPPGGYYYPPPHHGGYFSDENPNGCMIM